MIALWTNKAGVIGAKSVSLGYAVPFEAPQDAARYRGAPRLRRGASERGGLGGPF